MRIYSLSMEDIHDDHLQIPSYLPRSQRPSAPIHKPLTDPTYESFLTRELKALDFHLHLPQTREHILSNIRIKCFYKYCQEINNSSICNWKCPRCWMMSYYCMCSELEQISIHKHKIIGSNSLSIYMHHDEFMMSSNTAKLLFDFCFNSVYIFGNQQHEQKFINTLTENRHKCMVLWPCKDSVSIAEFIARNKGWNEELGSNKNGSGFHIVLIDGAWSQSSTLNRRIPREIQRVHLSVTNKIEFEKMRDHGLESGLNSIIAFRQTLKEINEFCQMHNACNIELENSGDFQINSSSIDLLSNLLSTCADLYHRQKCHLPR
uniref:tRNA-uridine aminocarboxypropyltransferase n=1 Tax=Timspurckia oligopyrenoides TaxID=708627 RepID=A0A7S1ERM7_9RHOD